MGKFYGKLLRTSLAMVLAANTLSILTPKVTIVEASDVEYEIYPTPHAMTYQEIMSYVQKSMSSMNKKLMMLQKIEWRKYWQLRTKKLRLVMKL